MAYWFFDWLDDQGIRDADSARRVLARKRSIDALLASAAAVPQAPPISRHEGDVLVAGCALDLSGQLDLWPAFARKRQLDGLLKNSLHYFDKVVVADSAARWDPSEERSLDVLVNYIDTLLHIRRCGADSLFVFRAKPEPCEIHWRDHARTLGLTASIRTADELTPVIASEADIGVEEHEDHFHYALTHPHFEHTVWGTFDQDMLRDLSGDKRLAAASRVVSRYAAHLVSDVRCANDAGAPLGASIYFHRRLLTATSSDVRESDVAFQLALPVLENISSEALLRVRLDEAEAFQRFKRALSLAIRERLNQGSSSSAEIGEQISADLIEPELARIRSRLKAAGESLSNKIRTNLTLGALATTCGVLGGAPAGASILAGAGMAAATSATAAAKMFDERSEVNASDMYFLWRATQHK